MARIRSIKPEFWTDEKVVELSAMARLLFIGLWNFADDEGRMVYSAKRLKLQIFPADSCDIATLVEELCRQELVSVYYVEATAYLQVNGFVEHQKIDKRAKSKHPAPPISAESPRLPPISPEPRQIPPLDQGRDQGKEGKGGDAAQAPPAAKRGIRLPDDWMPDDDLMAWAKAERPDLDIGRSLASFCDYWRAKPGQAGCKLDWPATFRNWIRNERRASHGPPPAPRSFTPEMIAQAKG
jgi:hypothetical protein